MTITIDNTAYTVGIASIKRSYRRVDKYSVVTEDGVNHWEQRAAYLDFALTLGNVSCEDYDELTAYLHAATDNVTITLPSSKDGTTAYVGRFTAISDAVELWNEDGVYYDSLTLTFTGTQPLEVT